jgi:hypothetical protein
LKKITYRIGIVSVVGSVNRSASLSIIRCGRSFDGTNAIFSGAELDLYRI